MRAKNDDNLWERWMDYRSRGNEWTLKENFAKASWFSSFVITWASFWWLPLSSSCSERHLDFWQWTSSCQWFTSNSMHAKWALLLTIFLNHRAQEDPFCYELSNSTISKYQSMIQDFDNFTRKNKKFSNDDFFKDQQSTTSSMTFRIL